MKNNIYIPNRQLQYMTIVDIEVLIDIPNTHLHDCSLSWLGTRTSIKDCGV